MPFKKFVEIGRIAVLGQGPDAGKIAAIVNVIDQNRVLIDGPTSGVSRQEYPLKQLELTPLRVKFAFNARSRVVRKEMEANKVIVVFSLVSGQNTQNRYFNKNVSVRLTTPGRALTGPRGWSGRLPEEDSMTSTDSS